MIIQLIFLLTLKANASTAKFTCSAELTVPTSAVKVIEDKYISVPLDFAPNALLREKLEAQLRRKLLHRGESHITVATPSEFDALKTVLTAADIHRIVTSLARHEVSLKPVCIGKAEALIEGQREQTYFVVVEAPALLQLRRELQDAFVSKGGKPDRFKAEIYYPHITLGFTKRDLYEADRVTKGLANCEFRF